MWLIQNIVTECCIYGVVSSKLFISVKIIHSYINNKFILHFDDLSMYTYYWIYFTQYTDYYFEVWFYISHINI